MTGTPLISVIVPTVPGREDHFGRCVAAYEADAAEGGYDLDLIVEHDHPAVGYAWQAGGEKARGDYLHFTNDDLVPHPGWAQPAVAAVNRGYIPAPQVYGPGGEPQAPPVWGRVGLDWTLLPRQHAAVVPFLSRQQWGKIRPLALIHYYADDFITGRARAAGWPAVLRTGYAFTHHWATVRRGAGMTQDARMAHDKQLYEQAMQMCAAGQWTRPWPAAGEEVSGSLRAERGVSLM